MIRVNKNNIVTYDLQWTLVFYTTVRHATCPATAPQPCFSPCYLKGRLLLVVTLSVGVGRKSWGAESSNIDIISRTHSAELDSCGDDSALVILATCPIRQYQQENVENMLAASKIQISISMQLPFQLSIGNHSTLLLTIMIVSWFFSHPHLIFLLLHSSHIPVQTTKFDISGDSQTLQVGFGALWGCF